MPKLLLPIDGSDNANKAVNKVIEMMDWYKTAPEIHLLNVQTPFDGNVALFINRDNIDEYHREEGLKCLQKAFSILDQKSIKYEYHVTVGNPADRIEQFATELQCDLIVISAYGHGAIKNLLLGSMVNKLIQLATKPVLLVK